MMTTKRSLGKVTAEWLGTSVNNIYLKAIKLLSIFI